MKLEHAIIIAMGFLVFLTIILVFQNPEDIPQSKSIQKHAYEITQINEESKKHQQDQDSEKFEKSKKTMQEKIKNISSDLLEIKISKVELLDGQYPFWEVEYRAEKLGFDPAMICAFEQDIPLHLEKISETRNFKLFSKKYTSYTLELIIMDERNKISNIHYGLIATNDKKQSASTYFHVDSCTMQITDKNPYFLNCSDENVGYRYATFNHDDIVSSYSNGHFCKIELDSWRQSLLDYSEMLYEQNRKLEIESINEITDQEEHWKFFSEMNRLGELRNLAAYMIHNNPDENTIKEKIAEYEKKHGEIPGDLADIIEKKK